MKSEITPYTENTKEVRKKLEAIGYRPLSFFQGKKYIRPMICTWANKDRTWKTYEYSTFEDSEKLTYHTNYLEENDFVDELTLLKNKV
jgi:hypothetical protein